MGCKSIDFNSQKMMFYPSITMLLHCKTYTFGKANLFFDQIKENSSLDGEYGLSRKKKSKNVTKG